MDGQASSYDMKVDLELIQSTFLWNPFSNSNVVWEQKSAKRSCAKIGFTKLDL
jgi:hypothetical protein